MAPGPINSWEIDGETVGTVSDFIFWVSKITADGDCSHEIKRHLLLGRKVMVNLDSILKSRDITLSTKVCLVKAMVFPVVMYGCESWTIKKPEPQRIDAFELWCYTRLLRVSWTARRSNQSILKEISPRSSLERLMLRLKLQYSGHLMQRADSLEKSLMLGKIKGRRRKGRQRMRQLDGITDSMDMSLGRLLELVIGLAYCSSWGCKVSDMTEWLNWTDIDFGKLCFNFNLCQGSFWFSLWFLCRPTSILVRCYLVSCLFFSYFSFCKWFLVSHQCRCKSAWYYFYPHKLVETCFVTYHLIILEKLL